MFGILFSKKRKSEPREPTEQEMAELNREYMEQRITLIMLRIREIMDSLRKKYNQFRTYE